MPSQPDAIALKWGYTRAFRAVVRSGLGQPPDPAKWLAYLPASIPRRRREQAFDALATAVMGDRQAGMCSGAKMALEPLAIEPHRVVVVFYCAQSQARDLVPVLRRHARATRRVLVEEGHLAAGDGFLGGWALKTDAQTTAQFKAGTHPAQLSVLVALGLMAPPAPRRPRR